eukprot:1948238-Rhodomonas_salina.1
MHYHVGPRDQCPSSSHSLLSAYSIHTLTLAIEKVAVSARLWRYRLSGLLEAVWMSIIDLDVIGNRTRMRRSVQNFVALRLFGQRSLASVT